MSGKTVREMLAEDLPRDVQKKLPSGHDYVTSHWVISRLNTVFGYDGWSITYGSPTMLAGPRPVFHVPSLLVVTNTGSPQIQRADVGVGIAATDKPDAIETALKAAYTDGLKRAARTLGASFGLALYDKDRADVGASTVALEMLAEIDAFASQGDADAWAGRRAADFQSLHDEDLAQVNAAFDAKRRGLKPLVTRTLADQVIYEVRATKTLEDLSAVRGKYATKVRELSSADLQRVKAETLKHEKTIRETT